LPGLYAGCKLQYGGRKLPMMANPAIYHQISRFRLQTPYMSGEGAREVYGLGLQTCVWFSSNKNFTCFI